MTREYKVSIIVAFGLLLFVSMLIADHISKASTKEVFQPDNGATTPIKLPDKGLIVQDLRTESNTPTTTQSGDTVRRVLPGETLRSICRDAYGDSGLATTLAQWNGMTNANNLSVGQEISLPTRALLMTQLSKPATVTIVEAQQQTNLEPVTTYETGTYTVKSGDTLGEIAQHVMGSAKKMNVLIDFNKERIPNPDRLQVGLQLTYPIE